MLGKANNTLVRVCYKPANQAEEADKIFHKQLGEAHKC